MEVAKSRGFAQVVTKANMGYSRLDIATSTGRYLLVHRSSNLRSLNTRLLFMYWQRSVMGIEVAKARLAAKPNVDCMYFTICLRSTYVVLFYWATTYKSVENFKLGQKTYSQTTTYVCTDWNQILPWWIRVWLFCLQQSPLWVLSCCRRSAFRLQSGDPSASLTGIRYEVVTYSF